MEIWMVLLLKLFLIAQTVSILQMENAISITLLANMRICMIAKAFKTQLK